MAHRWEPGHGHTDLGEQHLRRQAIHAEDGVQPVQLLLERAQARRDRRVAPTDLPFEEVDARQVRGQQQPVVVTEPPAERLRQHVPLCAQRAPGQGRRVGRPVQRRGVHGAPRRARHVARHSASSMLASNSNRLHVVRVHQQDGAPVLHDQVVHRSPVERQVERL